jgi:ribosome-associated translation inhibitor RaiA
MTAKVTISVDKLKHVAEARISSGGAHLEAKESSDDMYTSIDRMIDKLDRQIRVTKGAAESRRRTAKTAALTDGVAASVALAPAKKAAKTARPAKKVAKKSKR